LHTAGIVLLTLTLLACGLHLVPCIWHDFHLPPWMPGHLLTFACGYDEARQQ
jgi:hypothetical protein